MDRHCDNAKVKSLACWQAVTFHLLATQKKVHSTWITPPCLAALGRKEYLALEDPRITQECQEVQKEETVVLAIVLQRCAIHAGASPSVFCRMVQELHKCLVLVVKRGNLFNMETEIWHGVRKDPVAPTSLKRAPSPTPSPPPASEPEGALSPEEMALVPRRQPLPPQVCSSGLRQP